MSAPCARLRTLQRAFRFSAITVPMPSSRSGPGWVAVVPVILKGRVEVAGSSFRVTNLPLHVTVTTVASLARTCPAPHGAGEPGNVALHWDVAMGAAPGFRRRWRRRPPWARLPASVAAHLPLVAASQEVLRHCGGRRGHPVSGCLWYERGPGAGTIMMLPSAFERGHGENGHCPKRPRDRGSFMATRHRESPG